MNDLFGPLSKNYCDYFYFLSVFSFLSFIIILSTLIVGLFYKKYRDMHTSSFLLFSAINSLIMYFINRLFYTMCVKSLS